MPNSEVSICSRALQILGDDSIINLAEDSDRARAVNLAYAVIRDAEIERRRWRFSVRRASLVALSAAPSHGYAYQYQVPTDFLALLPGGDLSPPADLADYRDGSTGTLYSLEGDKVLTDKPAPLDILYKARVEDAALFPSSFAEALSARIAYEICERITGSDAKQQLAMRRYKDAIREAARANAIQAAVQTAADGEWLMARLQ